MAKSRTRGAALIKLLCWLVILFVLVIVFTSLMLRYATNAGSGRTFGVSTVYPDSESYNIGSMEYSDTVSDIDIDWLAGSVEITVWDEDNIKLEENADVTEEDDKLRSRINGGKLEIKYLKSGLRFFEGIPVKKLTLYIPSSIASTLGELEISAVGDVKVNGLGVRELGIQNASGLITLDSIRASKAEIDTASGDICLRGDFGELDVDSASAKVDLLGSCEKVDIDTASGDVTLNGEINAVKVTSASGRVQITVTNTSLENVNADTASGDITLTVPSAIAGFTAELESASGSTTLRRGNSSQNISTYEYGNKNAAIFNLDSASGDIEIVITE